MSDFTSSTVLYHPTGARCTLALPSDAQAAFNAISEYLEVGFLVNAPVPIEGGKTLDVDYVIRCQFEYDGKTKERLYFYELSSKYTNSAMTVYPDDEDKVKAFEQAAGFTIASMPLFKGKIAPTSDSGEYFEKYARPVKFTVIRVFEEKSQKYPTGRWKLAGYSGASMGAQTSQNGAETKITPMPVQTTTSPKNAQNGASAPVVTESEETLLECTEVYAQKSGDSVSYVVKCGKPGNIVIYTRKPFQDAGYSTDDWNEVGGKGRTVATFNPPLAIVAKKHGQSLELVKVQF